MDMKFKFGDKLAILKENVWGAGNSFGQVVTFLCYGDKADSPYRIKEYQNCVLVDPGGIEHNPSMKSASLNGKLFLGVWPIPICYVRLSRKEEYL